MIENTESQGWKVYLEWVDSYWHASADKDGSSMYDGTGPDPAAALTDMVRQILEDR